jgi:ATP-dependent Clp protease, protease subunit
MGEVFGDPAPDDPLPDDEPAADDLTQWIDPGEEHAEEESGFDFSTVYVSFSAEIDVKTTESLISTLTNFANNREVESVYLLLSTPGGSVMHGMNLYNVLRAMPFHLITHNVGNIDSIGNAVFLAGDERYACPHTTFMFHGVGMDTGAGLRLELKPLQEMLDGIEASHKRIAAIIEERTELDAAQIEPLFLQATTKDAAYAVAHGIVHGIEPAQIPAGAPMISLVFER